MARKILIAPSSNHSKKRNEKTLSRSDQVAVIAVKTIGCVFGGIFFPVLGMSLLPDFMPTAIALFFTLVITGIYIAFVLKRSPGSIMKIKSKVDAGGYNNKCSNENNSGYSASNPLDIRNQTNSSSPYYRDPFCERN